MGPSRRAISGSMDNGKYIRCRNCEAIHHVTSLDRSPIYQYSTGEIEEIAADDWREFTARHAGHKLEPLRFTGNRYFPAGSADDPMNSAYLEVTNGAETFLLHRTRRTIEEPVRYAVVKGRLVEHDMTLEIQDREIRKEMRRHFSWAPGQPLNDAKVDRFIEIFRALVGTLDPKSVRPSEYSCENADVSYGRLDAQVIHALMAKCREHFSPSELQSIGRFVETHSDDDGLMAPILRRSVRIEPRS